MTCKRPASTNYSYELRVTGSVTSYTHACTPCLDLACSRNQLRPRNGVCLRAGGGQPDIFHVNRLLENPQLPVDYQILCIPGGFNYGDDVAAGRILGNQSGTT